MAKTNQNDTFYANNKRTLQFAVVDQDAVPPSALDLTGCKVQWALSRLLANGSWSTTPVLSKNSWDIGGVTIVDVVGGIIEVDIEPGDTASLSGKYYQELEVIDGNGAPVVIGTGTITLLKNVINPT